MEVGDLKDFELSILANAERGFFDLGGGAAPDCEMSFGPVARIRQLERLSGELPAWTGFDRISAEEDIDGCYSLCAV